MIHNEQMIKDVQEAVRQKMPLLDEWTHNELANAAIQAMQPYVKELVNAAREMSDWFMEHSRQADHAHSELKQPLHETTGWKELIDAGYNGLMASYHSQFEQALPPILKGTHQ